MIRHRILVVLGLIAILGCDAKPAQKQVGTLKEWVVGTWMRTDDRSMWNFSEAGEVMTSGRVPIGGSYGVEEPNKVNVLITGSGAVTAGMQLGLPLDEAKNLKIQFLVKDDEMKPVGSTTIFKKK